MVKTQAEVTTFGFITGENRRWYDINIATVDATTEWLQH